MHNSILTKGFLAAEAIPAARAVTLNAQSAISLSTGIGSPVIGVSGEIDSDSGTITDVILSGIAEVQLSGNVSAGQNLAPDAEGKVKAATSSSRRIGLALGNGVSGSIIPMLVLPA